MIASGFQVYSNPLAIKGVNYLLLFYVYKINKGSHSFFVHVHVQTSVIFLDTKFLKYLKFH